jgi:radical SAM protein with 4Fe4S-binding SPASM domain
MHLNPKEAYEIGRHLTPRKLWNAAQVVQSFYASRWRQQPRQRGLPISVGIEPTTACNLGCPHCPSGLKSFSRPTGRLPVERFQALVDELHPYLLYLILYFQGEPYLNPKFLEMAEYAYRHNIFTMSSTNAHFLTASLAEDTVRSGMGRLVVSMDGVTQETYETYRRNGNLQKVLDGTANLVAAKRKLGSARPFIDLQFIVFSHNEHEIAEAKQKGKELGVDRVSIKTAQIYDYTNQEGWIPEQSEYARYERGEDGNYHIKNEMLNYCWKLWHSAEMTWDGRVLPCCFDKDAQHEMGTFPEQSFYDIWQGAAYQAFRRKLLHSRKNIDICQNCTEGTRVWA